MENLKVLRAAYHEGRLRNYMIENEHVRIPLSWPLHRNFVISSVSTMPFPVKSYDEIEELWTESLCCNESFHILGYVEHAKGNTVISESRIIIIIGEDERFYAMDVKEDSFFLLAENFSVFVVLGLHRYDPIYLEFDIPYILEPDDIIHSLIGTKYNLLLFSQIVAKHSGKQYRLHQKYEKMGEMFILFLVRREEFPDKDWTFLHSVRNELPFYGHIIGSVGENYLNPKTMFIMMNANGVIYGIDTTRVGLGACVKIAENFEVFLRQGVVRGYRRYKFFKQDLCTMNEISATCPHLALIS